MSTCSSRCLKPWDALHFLANPWGKNSLFCPKEEEHISILLYGRRTQDRATAPAANKEKMFGVDTEWQGVTTQPKCCPQPSHISNPSLPLPAALARLAHALCHTVSPGCTWDPSPRNANPFGVHVLRQCTGCTNFKGSLDETGLRPSQVFLERRGKQEENQLFLSNKSACL